MFDFDPNAIWPGDLERLAKESQEAMGRIEGVVDDLCGVTGEGEAADGMIKATVDGSGGLTGVTIAPRAMRRGSEAVAEEIVTAVRAAQEDAQSKVQELMGKKVGIDSLSRSMVDPDRVKAQFERIKESFSGRVEAYERKSSSID